MPRRLAWIVLAAAMALATPAHASGTSSAPSSPAAGWSAPQSLSSCAAGSPQIAFPSSSPASPSGPGAVVWLSAPGECAGRPAGGAALELAWLGAGERPAATVHHALRLSGGPAPALQALGGSEGRVTALEPEAGRLQVFQARDRGPLRRVLALASAGPAAITRGYLGDVAVATVAPSQAIAIALERHYASSFAAPVRIAIAPGAVSSLTLAMDFRSDLLLVWQQNGAIYAHVLRASGRSERTQVVGPSEAAPQIQATVSDNNHGMIAWSSVASGSPPRTTVRLALSGVNVRFEGSSTLASFADPAALGRLAGTLALVRLAGENVVLAWTERRGGRYRVLAAPAAFAATRPPTVLTPRSEQAALAGLAPGPANEAIALWRRLGPDPARWSEAPLWSARLNVVPHDRVAARPAAQVSAEGTPGDPALAVNPGDDHALVAWLGRTGVRYAVASGNATYRPHAYIAPSSPRGKDHPVAAVLAGALLVLIAAGWVVHLRRRRPDPAGRARRWPL